VAKKKAKKDPVRRVQLSDAANPNWQELFETLWPLHTGSNRFQSHYDYRAHDPEKVRLSQVGWDQIKQIIAEKKICVSVQNSCSGFSCSLALWKDREEPYPGAVSEAEVFFKVCSHMLPGNERSGFKDGWAEFEPLFTSDENVERLKANCLELPKHASHYDY